MILDGQLTASITQAAQALKRGDLLGLPTETVYGLAADAGNDAAVGKIFQAKGRPSNHPLIVHVASVHGAQRFASEIPAFAQQLMAAFWPGPLTLILPRQADQAAVAAGGQNSVGLRCPSHPVAQAVLRAAETLGVMGVAAPSANLFGRVSPTTAAHVASEFGDDLLILDGGACEVGIESTIVDCTRGEPVLLRPGVLTPERLEAACGVPVPIAPEADAPRASGTLASHYAPKAQVHLLSAAELLAGIVKMTENLKAGTSNLQSPELAIWTRTRVDLPSALADKLVIAVMPDNPKACAKALFAQLRNFDAMGVKRIWVERPPVLPSWAGVLDRLTRAAEPDR
jgi:L-threonylcarbamoyladenylate synthase